MAEDVTAIYRLKFKDLASKGLLKVQGIAKGMGKALTAASKGIGLAALGASAAAIKITDAFANRGDEINKFARQVNVSAESLQALEFIANRQGASFDKVKSGLEKFTKSMGEFRAGTGSLKTVLDRVDPALGKQLLSIRDNSEAFDFPIKKLSEYEDVQKQAAVSSALFGRSGGASFMRIVDGGAEAFKALNAEALKFRPPVSAAHLAIAEKYMDAKFNTQQVIKSLTDRFGSQFLPLLTNASTAFNEFVVANRDLINTKIDRFVKGVGDFVKGIDFNAVKNTALQFKDAVAQIAKRAGELIQKAGGLKTVVIGLVGVFAAGKILSFGSALAGVVALIGGPVTLAISAAVAAGVLLWKNWDTIKAKAAELGIDVDAVWSTIKSDFETMKPILVEGFKVMGKVAEFQIKTIVKAFNILKEAFRIAGVGIQNLRTGFSNA